MSLFFPKSIGGNAKTGMLTSTSSKDTCPDHCPHKGKGCYARFGNLARVWKNVSEGTWETPLPEFLDRIRSLPSGSLWRFNQSGDLPGKNNAIDVKVLSEIVRANKGRKGFTYTHKPLTPRNLKAIQEANQNGFTINISLETLTQVDTIMAKGLPAVVILPENTEGKVVKTPEGRSVLICPQQRNPLETCARCGLCQKKDRSYAIGFKAHGNAKRIMERTLTESEK